MLCGLTGTLENRDDGIGAGGPGKAEAEEVLGLEALWSSAARVLGSPGPTGHMGSPALQESLTLHYGSRVPAQQFVLTWQWDWAELKTTFT